MKYIGEESVRFQRFERMNWLMLALAALFALIDERQGQASPDELVLLGFALGLLVSVINARLT